MKLTKTKRTWFLYVIHEAADSEFPLNSTVQRSSPTDLVVVDPIFLHADLGRSTNRSGY